MFWADPERYPDQAVVVGAARVVRDGEPQRQPHSPHRAQDEMDMRTRRMGRWSIVASHRGRDAHGRLREACPTTPAHAQPILQSFFKTRAGRDTGKGTSFIRRAARAADARGVQGVPGDAARARCRRSSTRRRSTRSGCWRSCCWSTRFTRGDDAERRRVYERVSRAHGVHQQLGPGGCLRAADRRRLPARIAAARRSTTLARSTSLWERRIAIVATHHFIRQRRPRRHVSHRRHPAERPARPDSQGRRLDAARGRASATAPRCGGSWHDATTACRGRCCATRSSGSRRRSGSGTCCSEAAACSTTSRCMLQQIEQSRGGRCKSVRRRRSPRPECESRSRSAPGRCACRPRARCRDRPPNRRPSACRRLGARRVAPGAAAPAGFGLPAERRVAADHLAKVTGEARARRGCVLRRRAPACSSAPTSGSSRRRCHSSTVGHPFVGAACARAGARRRAARNAVEHARRLGSSEAAASARRTSTPAPSPTMATIASIGQAAAAELLDERVGRVGEIGAGIDERAVEIEDDERVSMGYSCAIDLQHRTIRGRLGMRPSGPMRSHQPRLP